MAPGPFQRHDAATLRRCHSMTVPSSARPVGDNSDLELPRPDDWHVHLRDAPGMADVLAPTARVFARALVMPNLRPPVTTTALAAAYRARILAALPQGSAFEPLMTLYLTDETSPDEIRRAKA